MPAPEGGFPRFDGYDVVSVRVREATITATNRDAEDVPCVTATSAYVYDAGPAHSAATTQSQAQPYMQHVMPQPQPVITPGMAVSQQKSLIGRDIAIWICVAQLGVIIWCLLGPMMQKRDVNTVLVKTVATWPGEFGKAFNSAKANVIAQVAHVARPSVKKPPKGGKKPYAHKGFVPPPPPELVSNPRMMVPPPPVAYHLPMPGAVAASTLPSVPATLPHASVAAVHSAEEVLTPHTVPSAPATREAPPVVVAAAAAAEDHEPAGESAPLPVPDWLQQVPTYNWHDATSEPTTPVRTVMNGNRRRTITDR